MRPEVVKHLQDVRTAAEWIVRFTHGRTELDFGADEMLRSAVERKFEIIGEALNRLRRDAPATADKITAVQRIIGFRNVLIHGYDRLDNEISWDAVETKLPVLRKEVDSLLADASANGGAEEE